MMFSSFRGGIHPPENKKISEGIPFSNLSIPQTCYIPLQQHIGAPARPVVEIGDVVEEGQLIGKGEGFVSANVHSSVPGKVIDIIDHETVYGVQPTIIIEADGAFSASSPKRDAIDWTRLEPEDILTTVKESGIVGLGGAAFPTSVKLNPPSERTIDTLVINGAECEPYLTVDDMLMQTYPEDIIEGIRITLKVLGIKKAVIGIEKNKMKAVKALKDAVARMKPAETIEVKALKTMYPQGAEKQLIYSLLRRTVPARGLPMDVNVIVQNVGTIFAIREAVMFNKPLYERYITVSGSMINKPGNYKIRVGMSIDDIIEECGGLKGDPAKIVIGGPMCGLSIADTDIPVVKGTSGILFLSKEEIDTRQYDNCIRCGRCVSICPMGLMPCEIAQAVENDRLEIAEDYEPYDCIMCGSCSYICPSQRPISHFIKLAQELIQQEK